MILQSSPLSKQQTITISPDKLAIIPASSKPPEQINDLLGDFSS